MPTFFEHALPQQRPIPAPRNSAFVEAIRRSKHTDDRQGERDLTDSQVFQTIADGQVEPDKYGTPGVKQYTLNSINTPGTRRRVLVNHNANGGSGETITAYRMPIPQASPRPANNPTKTKANKKAQLAKKRARSKEANG